MLAANSTADVISCGTLVTKLNRTFGGKEKYLWGSHEELRWSDSSESRQSFSKLNLDQIVAVKGEDRENQHILVIESTHKTYRFAFKNQLIREKWHVWLSHSFQNYVSASRSAKKRNRVLGENNKGSETGVSQQKTVKEVMGVIKKFAELCDKREFSENDYAGGPKCLEDIISICHEKKWEIQQETAKKIEDNDPKRLTNKISMLRKRIKMLDIEKDSPAPLENIQFMIEKEKQQIQYLQSKISEAQTEKNKAYQEWFQIKSDFDKAKTLKSWLEKSEKTFPLKTVKESLQFALQKGFICYISTLASSDHHNDLTLTPRRGYEEGVYKKRQVSISSDSNNLIWKAVGLFSSKKIVLNINDIYTVIEGTEDPVQYEPFAGYKYISIVSKGLTVMMCIENYFSFYLDGIRELYMSSNSLPSIDLQMKPQQICMLTSEHLQNQILTVTRMYKRYKSSLIESISTINLGTAEYQKFFSEEIEYLKVMNEKLPIGIMAFDSEEYLRSERVTLNGRLDALRSFISSKAI